VNDILAQVRAGAWKPGERIRGGTFLGMRHHSEPAPDAPKDGWKLVPLQPTKEMCAAGEKAVEENIEFGSDTNEAYLIYNEMKLATEAYLAMLEAAPAPDRKENT